MLGVPEGIDELLTLVMAAEHRGCCGGGHETDAVAQFAETAGLQDLVALGQCAISTILVDESVNTLAVEEVLDGLTILALPLTVGTAPFIVEGDVHRHTPGVIAEVVAAITTGSRTLRTLWHTRETGHLHLTAVVLAHVGVQTRLWVDGLMQVLTAFLGAFFPIITASVVSPLRPDLIEGGNMIRGIGITLTETVGCEGDELRLGVDEVHLLGACLLGTKAGEACRTGLGLVFLRLDAVEDVLGLGLVVDACVVAPAVRGKEKGGDEIEFAIGGSALSITGAVGLTAPSEITFADAVLVLHVLLGPAPQAVEDVFLAELHGDHQTIRHTLGAGVVVLHVGDVAHGVAHLEIHLVGSTEHIVEHFLQFGVDIGLAVAHLDKEVTVLACLKCALLPGGESHGTG